MIFEEEVLAFLRGHASWRGEGAASTDILSVCTGALPLRQSRILDGKRASGPRALVRMMRKKFPEVDWVDNKRWVQEGNIWSSGKLCFAGH